MKALDLIEATGQIDDRIILEVTSTMKNSRNHSNDGPCLRYWWHAD